MKLVAHKTKTLEIKENGRSSDFVTPNFMLSCNAGCKYCYTYRFGREKIFLSSNMKEILLKIRQHAFSKGKKQPNQTDDKFWTYDIGCDTDISYHWKDYPWDIVLKEFSTIENGKAVFATKFVNNQLLKYGNEHLRIRFSLMPQSISEKVEKNTAKMRVRIDAINRFIESGWDVHINISPIIYYEDWLSDYKNLMEEIDKKVKYKDIVKAEVIFLTHNEYLHNKNIQQNFQEAEELLWKPSIQEIKTSQYGGQNLRYKWQFKNELINQYKELHNQIIPWCKIRYIF